MFDWIYDKKGEKKGKDEKKERKVTFPLEAEQWR